MLRLRTPLSLVAVFVLIAVIAAVLVGGRLVQDWNAFHRATPAGVNYEAELAQLEARPLHIPSPKTLDDCKSGPYNAHSAFGTGPVYGTGGWLTASNWGTYYHNLASADSDISGPILVRAVDLFKSQRVVFIGPYATGPAAGTDTVDGHQYAQRTEVVFDTTKTTKGVNSIYKYNWQFIAGVPNTWSGSTGWQIDGLTFSETFLAC